MIGSVATLLLVVLTSASASELPKRNVDLYYTMGMNALETGDCESAFSYLEKARIQSPQDSAVRYAQAQSAICLRRYGKAEELLADLEEDRDVASDALFSLAYVYYLQGRYREAVVAFDKAENKGCRTITLSYLRGASLFRLGDYDRAIGDLDKASKTIKAAESNIRYYLGASYYHLGKYAKASDELAKVVKTDGGSPLGKAASELMEESRRRMAETKWYNAVLELGSAYDSNVLYESEMEQASGREGFFGFGLFDGTIYPVRSENGRIGVGYHFYQSYHLANRESELHDFDLLRNAGSLEMLGSFRAASIKVLPGMFYEFSDALLDGLDYQQTHDFRPNVTFLESEITATRAQVIMKIKRFPGDSERDARYFNPALMQIIHLSPRNTHLALETGFEQNDAQSDYFDYRGVEFFAGADFSILESLTASMGMQYRYLDFVFHPEHRKDHRFSLDTAVKYSFIEHLSAKAEYKFFSNDSLRQYRYRKSVASISGILEF